ncbi:AAA family ATPase [Evansella sp. AB-rgal1]|uniref:AAA family ATPase n=1 Tax=Evansella sp. AB-rgal1 TaxID=3242696 RepID=UPI00359E46E0
MENDGYFEKENILTVGDFSFIRSIHSASSRQVIIRKGSKGIELERECQEWLESQLPNILNPMTIHNEELVFEHVDGKSLRSLLNLKELTLENMLSISLQLVETLQYFHMQNKPNVTIVVEQIIVDSNKQIKILPIPYLDKENNEKFQTPETILNTAMTNSEYSSDLYRFGLLLYELFTNGKHPFTRIKNPDWKHCHIAVMPTPVSKMNPEIPKMINNIVMTLLEKEPKNRYQDTNHLAKDLLTCYQELIAKGTIQPFRLCSRVSKGNYEIPNNFYGREKEVKVLYDHFQSAAFGATEVVYVTGAEGIGKTTLVNKQFKRIIQNRSFYIYGKCTPNNNGTPFDSLVDAFRDLVRQILMQKNDQVAMWKEKLLKALGKNGQIITNVIPELESLLGKQPPVEVLTGQASTNRFFIVFRQFVQVFTSENQPLVLFLDDIHFADFASLRLMYSLLIDPNTTRFIVIAAFTTEAVQPFERLMKRYDNLKKYGVSTTQIEVEFLSINEVEQFVADTLACDRSECRGLSQLIYQKTGGSPLYMKEMLRLLHKNQWIEFNFYSNKWTWMETEIQSIKDQEHILEYMEKKIRSLPMEDLEIMKIAACLGNQFYYSDLLHFTSSKQQEVTKSLENSEKEGIILSLDTSNGQQCYHFFHEKIHEIAYSLVEEMEKQVLHLTIARYLMDNQYGSDKDLFHLVNHYNHGATIIEDPIEKEMLFQLNCKAAKLAETSTAYETAAYYYRHAVTFIDENKWNENFEGCFSLYLALSNMEYLSGNHELALCINTELLRTARNWEEKAQVYKHKIMKSITRGDYSLALEQGIICLREIGIDIPCKPSEIDVKRENIHARVRFPNGFKFLYDIPEATDEKMKLAMDIMFLMLIPTFYIQRNSFKILVNKFMELILQYGKTDISPAVFAYYGLYLSTELNDMQRSYEIGNIAAELAEKYATPSVMCKTYVLVGGNICKWFDDKLKGESYLSKAIDLGIVSGDYIHTNLAITTSIANMYTHDSLFKVEESSDKYYTLFHKTKDDFSKNVMRCYKQFVQCLQGKTDQPITLNNEQFHEDVFLENVKHDERSAVTITQYYTFKVQIYYLNGQYKEALQYAALAEKYMKNVPFLPHYGEFLFYKALTILRFWKHMDGEDRRQYLTEINIILHKFSGWREYNKRYYEHKEWILRAEYAKMQEYYDKAEILYEQAIKSATESGTGCNVAICLELAGSFYEEIDKDRLAKQWIKEAVSEYRKWGATLKAENLEKRYSHYFTLMKDENLITSQMVNQLSYQKESASMVNISTIWKATETLSQEGDHFHTLRELMISINRESLAEKAVLLKKEGDLIVVVAVNKGSNEFSIQSEELEKTRDVPQEIVRYIARTHRDFVIEDVSNEDQYYHYPYFRRQLPRSVLCLPIMLHGEVKGILYLENRWIANLFSKEKIEIARYLCTQAMFISTCIDALQPEKQEVEKERQHSDLILYDSLTERELEILQLMAAGMSNEEIARKLKLKIGTVKVHNHNIFSKLDVNRRTKAVYKAKELKLIDIS